MIRDEFTNLEVSRQRKWQLRNQRDGKCHLCNSPVATDSRCLKHAVAVREHGRKKKGSTRRNKSWTYELEALNAK